MQFLFTVICAALAAAVSAVLLAPEAKVSVEQASVEVPLGPGA
jgi:hypothetical protein